MHAGSGPPSSLDEYPRTHGVVANGIPLPLDAPSIAAYLAEEGGYRTALLGKAHFEPGFDPQLRFEENARAARGDTGPWRGFERSEQAMHAAAWGTFPIAHYGRWLAAHHPEHLHSFAGLLQAEPAGPRRPARAKDNPIPRAWYHTDWVADLTIEWLNSLRAEEPFGSAGCRFPIRTTPGIHPPPKCTGCRGRNSTCRLDIRGPMTRYDAS